MKEKLKSIVNKLKKIDINSIYFDDIREELESMKENNSYKDVNETIWNILNDFPENKCKVCGNITDFRNIKLGYYICCSNSCRAKSGAHGLKEKLKEYSEDELTSLYEKQNDARVKTFKEKYGVENPMKIPEIKEKNHESMFKTNLESGRWLKTPERKGDYTKYCYLVEFYSEKQNLKSLSNIENRGSYLDGENAHHLDHKFSKKQGFLNNIPPHIIGSIHNLEMLPFRINCKKVDKCSITKEELFELFFSNL